MTRQLSEFEANLLKSQDVMITRGKVCNKTALCLHQDYIYICALYSGPFTN